MITFLSIFFICMSAMGFIVWLFTVALDGYNRQVHSFFLLVILLAFIVGLICALSHSTEANKIKYYRVYNVEAINCNKYKVTVTKKMPNKYDDVEKTFETNDIYKLGQRVYKVPTGE